MPKRKIEIGCLRISPRAVRYVNEALLNNRLSYGPFSQKFESLFSRLHGTRFAVVSNSGTDALRIALAALKEKYRWKDNDEVLVPATTFIATSNVVIQNNLKPVFVDIEPAYYEMDPELTSSKITRRTRAMIPAHLFGQPADMTPLIAIAKKRKLAVIEDSAQTMFALYGNKPVGSLGEIGCFSTYVAHLLTTGVGGICTTNDPKLAVMIRSIVNHGRDSIYLNIDDDDNVSHKKIIMILRKRFSFVRLGYSSRLTELECAIGLAELEEKAQRNIIERRRIASHITEFLKPLEEVIQLPKIRPGNEHSFMVYPIVLKKDKKKRLVEFLEVNGVETRDLMPILNQPVYRKLFSLKAKDYPVSQWLINSGFFIGCHPNLSDKDLYYVRSLFFKFFKH